MCKHPHLLMEISGTNPSECWYRCQYCKTTFNAKLLQIETAEMTDERIAEIEARANAATKGPWVTHSMNDACVYADFAEEGRIIDCRWQPVCGIDAFAASRNGRFVAHARTDIPDLIAALRAARERIAAAQLMEEE
jgi:hypothetical protein